jgi:hypothetical protein
MPSSIHESIITRLTDDIITSRATLPANLRRQIQVIRGKKFDFFTNQWSGSRTEPDLGIQVCNADNEMDLKWVLEVRFSELYEQLKHEAQLWLEGSSQVSMVTIVRFCETPRYHCLTPIYNETGEEELDPREVLGIPSDFAAIRQKDIILEGDYGPATYKGLRWVEQISEGWIETWVRNADGRATLLGKPINLLQANQVQLEFGGFLPPGYPQTVTVDLEEFRLTLQHSIREMAVNRCRNALHAYLKRHGEVLSDDPDYQP